MGLLKKTQHENIRQPHIRDENTTYAFRRSRTMTGSSSDTVRAAAETRAGLQSDRLKHHTLRKKRRRLASLLVISLACAGGIIALLNMFVASTAVTTQNGGNAADTTAYRAAIDTYLVSHPNERFIFSLRQAALLQAIQKQYPEVRTVAVDVQPWLRAARVTVQLRTPIASWTIGATKYYIDSSGVAFQKNLGTEPTLVVEDNTGIDPTGNAAVASERMIRYIGRLVALVQQNGLTVERLELPPSTSREVDVYLAGKVYPIKTDIDRDPAGQVADLVQATGYLTRSGIVPSYADVRVSSKLYYK